MIIAADHNIRILAFLLFVLAPISGNGAQDVPEYLEWWRLPILPVVDTTTTQPGVAGPFVGVHNYVAIIAGGANFPMGMPWAKRPDGTAPLKVYHDDIYVLEHAFKSGFPARSPDGTEIEPAQGEGYTWHVAETKMREPFCYGVSISTPDGIICIGGEFKDQKNGEAVRRLSDRSFVMGNRNGTWGHPPKIWISDKLVGAGEDAADVLPLPPLPAPCAFMGGAKIGSSIYIAGGDSGKGATKNFWVLDLAKKTDNNEFNWKNLAPWPGPPRILPVVVAQSDGAEDCLYVMSGRNASPGNRTQILTDAYKYSPKSDTWSRIADVGPKGEAPRCIMAAPAVASGSNQVLVFGGAEGRLFLELEELDRKIADAGPTERIDALTKEKAAILENHPGFSRDVLAYNTVTDTWAVVGRQPTGGHVTTTAVEWGNGYVIPTGEISPGIRTRDVWKVTRAKAHTFGTTNYAVLGLYLLALVGAGVYFSRRMQSTDDFFKAGQRIPWWAAGISIFGTQLSAITFMAIPAKTFATDWRYLWGNMAIVAVAPFIVFWFLPFYRRLKVTTAYEYLEMRFNLPVRLLGSVMFMLAQFGRIGIVLYLPSIALSVVTGMDIVVCIVVMGLLCVFYTVLGGMEAVIWTDVLQVIVLGGGALLCLALIPFHVPEGWSGMIDIADRAGRLRLFDFRFSLADATFFTIFIGATGMNLISYGTDQTVIQRYLTTRTEKAAAGSIWTNAFLTVPATLLFFTLGTALFAFYKSNPTAMDPMLAPPDALFPFYIVTQLPAGVAGLLIAGVFAAAMSSLDSSMNSVSAAFTTDFYRRLRHNPSEQSCLKLARAITVAIGLLGIVFALWMAAQPNIKSLWDQFSKYLGMFGGGLAGLFLLAIFTRRAHGAGALFGLLASGAMQIVIEAKFPVHPWFRAIAGIVACFGVGYLASLVIHETPRPIKGLTIYSLDRRRD